MHILAILGSPRKGNSHIILNEALNALNQFNHKITLLRVCDLNISGCSACDGCKETGECIIDDDMSKIYPLFRDADRLIIASPIFFFGIPAQFKLLIDRCQSLWYEKYILKKTYQSRKRKAIIMLVGGMKKGEIGITCAEATLKAFLRTIDVKEHKTLSFLGYDEPGAILKNPEAFSQVRKSVIELIQDD